MIAGKGAHDRRNDPARTVLTRVKHVLEELDRPERLDVIVVKSANHYRGDYDPMASTVIPVDSPGLNNIAPSRYDYKRIRRPKFLVDKMGDDEYPDW